MRTWQRRSAGDDVQYWSSLEASESELIASMVTSLTELLNERESSAPSDDLAALTGIAVGHSQPPSDVTLGRLLPDFHRPDQDVELAPDEVNVQLNAALRSVNEPKIIAEKLTAADVVLETLPSGAGEVLLDEDQAMAWLTALNDVRLALGAMLGISEDTPDQLPPDHPHAAHLDVYHWLTVVQELLVESMM